MTFNPYTKSTRTTLKCNAYTLHYSFCQDAEQIEDIQPIRRAREDLPPGKSQGPRSYPCKMQWTDVPLPATNWSIPPGIPEQCIGTRRTVRTTDDEPARRFSVAIRDTVALGLALILGVYWFFSPDISEPRPANSPQDHTCLSRTDVWNGALPSL
uniref:Uncharacterized protein n=1 Tax=Mycena chlorophos TaxID=658473 RepID=A0ABQ0M3L4_MYCCL|nr:predicted protein [Mycena chlorophos]